MQQPDWVQSLDRPPDGQAPDWQLWVARASGCPATLEKSPTRLLVESRLRAWLLRRYHRCLFILSFAELCQIAERERHECATGVSDV